MIQQWDTVSPTQSFSIFLTSLFLRIFLHTSLHKIKITKKCQLSIHWNILDCLICSLAFLPFGIPSRLAFTPHTNVSFYYVTTFKKWSRRLKITIGWYIRRLVYPPHSPEFSRNILDLQNLFHYCLASTYSLLLLDFFLEMKGKDGPIFSENECQYYFF